MMIESLGVFVHVGNAIWNLYRLASGKKINAIQIANGVLALGSLIALTVGFVLMFVYPTMGAETIVVFALIAFFVAGAADYFIDPVSAKLENEKDSSDLDGADQRATHQVDGKELG